MSFFSSRRTQSLVCLMVLLVAGQSFAMHRVDMWIPQTHTLEQGAWQVTVERKATLQKEAGDPPGTAHASTFGSSFGLFTKGSVGVEGGLEWQEPAKENITNAIFGHIRIRANDVDRDGWSVALGLERLGFVPNKNDVNEIYLALQNKFAERWYLGVGAYTGSSRFLVDDTGKDDPRGGFLGVWRQIQQGRGRVGFEYQTGRNMLGFMFAGMTLELSEMVRGTIGYGFSNNSNLQKDWILTKITADF